MIKSAVITAESISLMNLRSVDSIIFGVLRIVGVFLNIINLRSCYRCLEA